jgi:hypothetical protein
MGFSFSPNKTGLDNGQVLDSLHQNSGGGGGPGMYMSGTVLRDANLNAFTSIRKTLKQLYFLSVSESEKQQ